MSLPQKPARRLRRPELEIAEREAIPDTKAATEKFTSPRSEVTKAEVVEAEKRKAAVVTPGLLRQDLRQLIKEEFATIFRKMKSLLKMDRVYNQNRLAKAANLKLDAGLRQGVYEPLAKVQSIRDDHYIIGSLPPIALRFPRSKADIQSMTRAEVIALIKFYALHVDVNGRGVTVAHLRDALHRWLTTSTDDDEKMEADQEEEVEDVPAEQPMAVTED